MNKPCIANWKKEECVNYLWQWPQFAAYFFVGQQNVQRPKCFLFSQVHQKHSSQGAHSLTVAHLAVENAVSDQHIEELLLLQVVALAKENVLTKLPIDVGVNLSCFGAMNSCEMKHSLIFVLIVSVGHHFTEVQQLWPHNVPDFVWNAFVDSLRQFFPRWLRIPLAQHLDPFLLALNQHIQLLFECFLVVLWRWKLLIVNESIATTKANANLRAIKWRDWNVKGWITLDVGVRKTIEEAEYCSGCRKDVILM